MFKNKVVLVTGGTGFIGSHLVDKALELNAEKVIALDNFSSSSPANVAHVKDNPNFELVEGDVRDENLIKKLVDSSDIIFHEAASKMVFCFKQPEVDLQTNITGAVIAISCHCDE